MAATSPGVHEVSLPTISEKRGWLTWAGGGPTVAAGLAFLALQAVLFIVLHQSLARQGMTSASALEHAGASRDIRQVLQGVYEMVVTDGSNSSRASTAEALDRLDRSAAVGGLADLAGSSRDAMRGAAGQFLDRRNFSLSDVDTLVALGKLTAQLDRWAGAADRRAAEIHALQAAGQSRVAALLGGMAAASFGGTLAIFWMFYVRVTRPLRRTIEVAERVASGNIAVDVATERGGEATDLLQALAGMQANLVNLVAGVRQGAVSLADAAGHIGSGSAELSSRTEEQAASLEQTASSMEELMASVGRAAQEARSANGLASSASQVARRGEADMAQVALTMDAIASSSRKVSEITSVIEGIAFQTNILALNAAVEAARAGEHGRGFAVVAAEVRALAQRSTQATREIKQLIDGAVSSVGDGSTLVRAAGTTMCEIVASALKVSEAMARIAEGSDEQAASIAQVGNAVTQMEQVTQRNAGLVGQSGAAVEDLSSTANNLVRAVDRFTLPAQGINAARRPGRRALPQGAPQEGAARLEFL